MNSFFSIIIPTLNEERFLPSLLESLASQAYQNFEVIVVDGNSQDKTVQKAKTFQKKFDHLSIVSCDTPGLPKQRNVGAAQAQGTWLLFVDADSVFLPHALDRLEMLLKNDPCGHVTPWFSPDSNNGSDALLTLIINASLETAVMMHRPVALGPFSGIKRDVFEKVQG